MKILVVHNRYRSDAPSGENIVVDDEIAALRAAGNDVVTYLRSSDEIDAMPALRKLTVPFQPLHSRGAMHDLELLIRRTRPDVVHLHNVFPLISMSVVRLGRRHDVPVVATLHNQRHSCMRGSYFRDGHPCRLCRGKTVPWPGVQHGCYRDSRIQSLPMAAALALHRDDQRAVDRYIAVTAQVAASIIESGWARPDQVVVRPHSVPDPGPPSPPGKGLLFVGRVSVEKGVPLLLDAWRRAAAPFGRLTIVGDGPESQRVQAAARVHPDVRFLGRQDRTQVMTEMRSCAAVVVPSIAEEALGLVALEAFAGGRPVVATAVGGLVDVVDNTVGWLAEPTADSLAGVLVDAASADVETRGRAARARYDDEYSTARMVQRQLDIYRSVIADRAGTQTGASETDPPG